MKVDIFKTIIGVAISGLFAYGCYAISDYENLKLLLIITAFVTMAVCLVFAIGVYIPDDSRKSVMLKTLSGIFWAIFLTTNMTFAFFEFNKPPYIILNGVLLLLYALIANAMWRTKLK